MRIYRALRDMAHWVVLHLEWVIVWLVCSAIIALIRDILEILRSL